MRVWWPMTKASVFGACAVSSRRYDWVDGGTTAASELMGLVLNDYDVSRIEFPFTPKPSWATLSTLAAPISEMIVMCYRYNATRALANAVRGTAVSTDTVAQRIVVGVNVTARR